MGPSSSFYVGRAEGAFRAGEGDHPSGQVTVSSPRPPAAAEERREPKLVVASVGAASLRPVAAPTSREDADVGCPREPSQPGEHQELQKQSEWAGGREGATSQGQSTRGAPERGRRLRARPASLGRARACHARCSLPGPGHPQSAKNSPFLRGGDLRKP